MDPFDPYRYMGPPSIFGKTTSGSAEGQNASSDFNGSEKENPTPAMDNSNISRNPWALGSFDASMIPFDPRLLSPLFQYQKQDQENETGISGFGQEQTAPSDLNGSVKRSPTPAMEDSDGTGSYPAVMGYHGTSYPPGDPPDDSDFLRNLRNLSGDDATWKDFEPSTWRDFHHEENNKAVSGPGQDQTAPSDDDKFDGENNNPVSGTSSSSSGSSEGDIIDLDSGSLDSPVRTKLSKAALIASQEAEYPLRVAALVSEAEAWKPTSLSVGDQANEGESFVPWCLVENYPNMFVGKTNRPRALPLFRLADLLGEAVWDLYYLHHSKEDDKPLILVPTSQFLHLLDIVNAILGVHFCIPPGRSGDQFRLTFAAKGGPRPRFLGRSDCAQIFTALTKSAPAASADNQLSDDVWKELKDIVTMARKGWTKASANKVRNMKRVAERHTWRQELKRVQRYLGVRETTTKVEDFRHLVNGVVFAAIDLEAWERNNDLITEIGVALLDSSRLVGMAPGETGRNWFRFVQGHHLRIKENAWAENKRHVAGCADKFDFGQSEFIRQSLAPQRVKELLESITFLDPADGLVKPRPLVLVFHDAAADIKFLKKLNFDVVAQTPHLVEVVDTRHMLQYILKRNNAPGLATGLNHLRIPSRHLHNAGNDAVYTLQVMMGVAVWKMQLDLGLGEVDEEEENDGSSTAATVAANDDGAESSSKTVEPEETGFTSNDDSDGGDPVHPTRPGKRDLFEQ